MSHGMSLAFQPHKRNTAQQNSSGRPRHLSRCLEGRGAPQSFSITHQDCTERVGSFFAGQVGAHVDAVPSEVVSGDQSMKYVVDGLRGTRS